LTKELNTNMMAALESLSGYVSQKHVAHLQRIFDVTSTYEFVYDSFANPLIGKVVCLLAYFLENY